MNQTELKSIIEYDPDTGIFNWKELKGRRTNPATTKHNGGYLKIHYKATKYFAHRLAFLYMKGRWPIGEVDHINRNKADNRWINLREVHRIAQMRNLKQHSNNSSGITGVYWIERPKRWHVLINKGEYLGRYQDFYEAVYTRWIAENLYRYDQTHGRKSS